LDPEAEGFDDCASEENFAPNPLCLAALSPNDPYWTCRADRFWNEAACFEQQDCSAAPPDLGVCAPGESCVQTTAPGVERFCGRSECAPGESLHRRYLCDGVAHCADGSDELNCAPGLGRFECSDGSQVMVQQLCDGAPDCPDGSDEGRCL
jgi:hypothetical protein